MPGDGRAHKRRLSMVTSVSSVSNSSSVMVTTASRVATAAKSASTPTVNVSALAKLFQAQVPVKTLNEALAIDVTNKSSLKVPFNLTLNQNITLLSADAISKLNKLVDTGVIASIKATVDPTIINYNRFDEKTRLPRNGS